MEYSQSSKSSSTTTVEIKVKSKEDGIPIYETTCNPISFSKTTPKITKEEVDGVPVSFLILNYRVFMIRREPFCYIMYSPMMNANSLWR
jgi:type IV secretory pathway component VirB8